MPVVVRASHLVLSCLATAFVAPAQSIDERLAVAMGRDPVAASRALRELRSRRIDQVSLCLCIDAMDRQVRFVPDEATRVRRDGVRHALVGLLVQQGPPESSVLQHAPTMVARLPDGDRRTVLAWLLGSSEDQRALWIGELRGRNPAPAFAALLAAEAVPANVLRDVAVFVHHPDERRELAEQVVRAHGGDAALRAARASADPWTLLRPKQDGGIPKAVEVALDEQQPWFLRVEAMQRIRPERVRHAQRPDPVVRQQLQDGVPRLLPLLLEDDLAIAAAAIAVVARCPVRARSGAVPKELWRCYADGDDRLRPFVGDLLRYLRGQEHAADYADRSCGSPFLHTPWLDRVVLEDARYVAMWRDEPLRAADHRWYPNEEQRAAALADQARWFRITGGTHPELREQLMKTPQGRRIVGGFVEGAALRTWLRECAAAGDAMQPHVARLVACLPSSWQPGSRYLVEPLAMPLAKLRWDLAEHELDRVAARVEMAWREGGASLRHTLLPVVAAMGPRATFAVPDLLTMLAERSRHQAVAVLDTLLACGRDDVVQTWFGAQPQLPCIATYPRYLEAAAAEQARRVLAGPGDDGVWQEAMRWGRWFDARDRGAVMRHALAQLTADGYRQGVHRLQLSGAVDAATRDAFAAFFAARRADEPFALAVADAVLATMPSVVFAAVADGALSPKCLRAAGRWSPEQARALAPQAMALLCDPNVAVGAQGGQLLGRILAQAEWEVDELRVLGEGLRAPQRMRGTLLALHELGPRGAFALEAVGKMALQGPHMHDAAQALDAFGARGTNWLARRSNDSERASSLLWRQFVASNVKVRRAAMAALLQVDELSASLRSSILAHRRWGREPNEQAWLLSMFLRHFDDVPLELLAVAPYLPAAALRRRAAQQLAGEQGPLAAGVLRHLLLDREPRVREAARAALAER